KKEPEALDRIREEIALCGDQKLTEIDANAAEEDARALAETIALRLQASLMLRFSPAGEAFRASRIDGRWGRVFGTLAPAIELRPILENAF
ncbi:MAG: DNA alkylation response protein, partial [Acidobacteriia bacterium]|nr:DNA alkylation response protein [Terriglobia bacterium]